MMTPITQAAAEQYVMASFGQGVEPYALWITILMVAGGVSALVACVWGAAPLSKLWAGIFVPLSALSLLGFAANDLEKARLISVPTHSAGLVQAVTVSGGGCTPTRTSISLENGTGVQVGGHMEGVTAGRMMYRKTIVVGGKEKAFLCQDDSTAKSCRLQL